MAKIKGAVVVDTERCKGCNLCVVACPLDVLALTTKEVKKEDIHLPKQFWKTHVSDVHLAQLYVQTDVSPFIKLNNNKTRRYGRRSSFNEG